ncbi:MAG TPA: Tim44/TimA family putative adaptor protein [Acetobacteraceae bacterium]|nr:Tim44/TimA family putative adaptor protein [Acetobacteraceae bacterium]
MSASGSFPIDLVLFGMIAAFLVLRLRSVLGKRTGYERPEQPIRRDITGAPVIEGQAEPVAPPRPARPLPDPASPLGETLLRMQGIDRGFDPTRFLDGAEAAFRLIVTAFAAGDRVSLRNLLSDDTYRAFESAIAAREAADETQRTEVRAIAAATIEGADLRGTLADVVVRFVSDQVNLTLGRDGQPVTGTDAVTEIVDLWTFERDLSTRDPTWRLAAARSA